MEPIDGQGPAARQYELLGLLGEGGFGAVYLARFLGEGGFEKLVAVKVLNAELEDMVEIARRLRDEARILGLLRHRAIVGVDRLTRLDGRWAVVMEYVVGEDLSQVVRRGRVPTGPALEIIAEVASALNVAWHMEGPNGQPLRLLHRDLKPANIRLTPDGDVKVLDFGVARAEFDTREAATRSVAFGTPSYMPPERLDLLPDGPEGDIYALGVVLFELLTQTRLPQTSANPKRHERVLDEASQGLRAIDVPAQVLQLVLQCLAYAPEARPKAGDLETSAVRLSRALGDDPLRYWAQRGVARGGHGHEPIGGSLSGVVLTEEPPSLLTAWERPVARPQLPRTPTPSLVPAKTGAREHTPTLPLVVSPPALPSRVSLSQLESPARPLKSPLELGEDDLPPTRLMPRAPPSPTPEAPTPALPAVSPAAPSWARPSLEPVKEAPAPSSTPAAAPAPSLTAPPPPMEVKPLGPTPRSASGRGARSTPEPAPRRDRRAVPIPQAAPPPRSRAVLLGAVLISVVIGGVALAFERLGARPPQPVVEAPVVVETPVVVEVEQAPVVAVASDAPKAPLVEPDQAMPSEQEKKPAPTKPKTPNVRFTGDARSVVLQYEELSFALSDKAVVVPPNRYSVLAAFGSGELTTVGSVVLKPGDVLTLDCVSLYRRCDELR